MKPLLKRSLQVFLILLVAGPIVYSLLPKPIQVEVGAVSRGPMRVTVDEDGKTRIKERYTVSSPLPGRLRRIQLHAGDQVEAGQTLVAVIEPTDPTLLDARARTEAHARVRAAQAAVNRAGAVVAYALAQLELAQSDLNSVQRLALTHAATPKELDDAVITQRVRQEELQAAKFTEDMGRFELQMAQAALAWTQPGGDDASQFDIRAPCSGRVLRVFQESTAVVSAGTALLEIGDPTDLEVVVDVLSAQAVRIKPRAPVWLEQWGDGPALHGTVRVIEPSAFTKVSALGVEEQRVNVIIDLNDPPEKRIALGDGYRVEARIVTWEDPNVLQVPTSALFRHDKEWAVFRIVEGRALLQTVAIGHRTGQEAQVLDGLHQDDLVIAHPSDKVTNGWAVVPR